MESLAKTHILFPKPLLKAIDRHVGIGHRSRFVIEAAEEKLKRIRFQTALKAAAGAWSDKRHPKLKSQQALNRYLKKARSLTKRRLKRSLHG